MRYDVPSERIHIQVTLPHPDSDLLVPPSRRFCCRLSPIAPYPSLYTLILSSKMGENAIHIEHARGRQFRIYNVLMVLLMSAGSMSYGYSASIIATTLAQPTFLAYFQLAGPDASSNANQLIATMNGLYQAGGFLAVFSTSYLADKWGRKMAIAVSAAITIFSGALLAGSVDIGMFIFFRFVSGAGAFMILAAVPVWMNEVVPPSIRGVLVDIHGAALLFGYMLATWIGYGFYLYRPTGNVQWRAPLAFQVVWPTILLCGMYWMPESPRWLLLNKRPEQAEAVLRKLHTPAEAEIEYMQIKRQMEIDSRLPSSYVSMFTKPSYRRRTLIGIATTCSVQFSGILVINVRNPERHMLLLPSSPVPPRSAAFLEPFLAAFRLHQLYK